MIRPDETDLSPEEYLAVRNNAGPFAKRVVARRRNLLFSPRPAPAVVSGYLFDADVQNGTIYCTWIQDDMVMFASLANEDQDDQTWQPAPPIDAGFLDRVRPSLVCTAGQLNIFYSKLNTVYCASSEDGWDWTIVPVINPGDIGVMGNVTHVAGESSERVFVAAYRGDYNTQFITATLGEAWTAQASDIYLPHKLSGMDAVTLDPDRPLATRRSLVVVSCDMPAQVGTKPDGTKVTDVVYRRNGIMAFIYRPNRWSDHFTVERFDDAGPRQYREHLFATRLPNGQLVVTAHATDGNDRVYHESIRYYFSRDGKAWELDEIARFNEGMAGGGCMVVNGKYTYMLLQSSLQRSYTTELTGTPAPEVELDLTPYVRRWSSNQSGGRSSALTIGNPNNWYATSMLAQPGLFSLTTEIGVWINGVQKLVPIAHELILQRSPSRERPTQEIEIRARDFSALLNSLKRSPHAREYGTQTIGPDKFRDTTGTGYGGLAHVYSALGSWGNDDQGWLVLKSNMKRGVALSTWRMDLWNGSVQAAFTITDEGTGQYAGLVFRAFDHGNMYSVEYELDSNVLGLHEVRSGKQKALATKPFMGWALGETHYIRARFRYGRVFIDTSDDGRSWTRQIDTIVPGQAVSGGLLVQTSNVQFEEGSVGFVGQGVNPEDEWSDEPYDYDFPPSPTQTFHRPNPALLLKGIGTIAAFSASGRVHRTFNFTSPEPTFDTKVLTSDPITVRNFVVDAFSYGTGSINGWIQCATGVGRVRDIFGSAQFTVDKTFRGTARKSNMEGSFGFPWVMCVNIYDDGLFITYTTDGVNWSDEIRVGAAVTYDDNYPGLNYYMAGVYLSSVTPGLGYVTALSDTLKQSTYKTTDWGATWALSDDLQLHGPYMDNKSALLPFHVPWNNGDPENPANAFYVQTGVDWFNNPRISIYRRQNGQDTNISINDDMFITGRWGFSSSVTDNKRIAFIAWDHQWAGELRALYLSKDGGTTKSRQLNLPGGEDRYYHVAISGDDPDTIYAWGEGGYIAYTEDWGATWHNKQVAGAGRLVGICGG